ncbi:MAG: YbdD/YjiX family protein [Pseudomonadota bacterium]|nr:YbdD/YjiX family protein [Pseudomonadota bacterium]
MNTGGKDAAAAAVAAAPADADAPDARLRERMRAVRQACRQIFGIPDYERYLAHMAAQHPDLPVLSRREFFARSIDRKYGKSGPRCC